MITIAAAAPLAQETDPTTLAPLDARVPLTYFIATGDPGAAYQSGDAELARWALDAWSEAGAGTLRFTPAPEATALVRVYWVPAGFGQYGEMRPIVVAGRRGASVYIRPDTDALGAAIAQRAREDPLFRDTVVYLTCLHELGHALGLEHTAAFEDIMYFFGYGGDILEYFDRYRRVLAARDDIASVSGLSVSDIGALRALYGVRSR